MSTPINDGGHAFPFVIPSTIHRPGMSLRDYFAGQALPAYIGHLTSLERTVSQHHSEIAEEVYKIADAMIAAREGKEGK